MQDDCIAVALGLPQLKILWQKELEDRFEVTVIYRREDGVPPFLVPLTMRDFLLSSLVA